MRTPAGKAAASGCRAATAHRGSRRTVKGRSRSSCISKFGPIRSQNSAGVYSPTVRRLESFQGRRFMKTITTLALVLVAGAAGAQAPGGGGGFTPPTFDALDKD